MIVHLKKGGAVLRIVAAFAGAYSFGWWKKVHAQAWLLDCTERWLPSGEWHIVQSSDGHCS